MIQLISIILLITVLPLAFLGFLHSHAFRHQWILLVPYHFCTWLILGLGICFYASSFIPSFAPIIVLGIFFLFYGALLLWFEPPWKSAVYIVFNGSTTDLREIILTLPDTEDADAPFSYLSRVGRSFYKGDPRIVALEWKQHGFIDIINTHRHHRFFGLPALKFFPVAHVKSDSLAEAIKGKVFQRSDAAGAFAEMLESEAHIEKTVKFFDQDLLVLLWRYLLWFSIGCAIITMIGWVFKGSISLW